VRQARLGRLTAAVLLAASSLLLVGTNASEASSVKPVLHIGVDTTFSGCDPTAQRTSSSTQMLLSLVLPETTVIQPGAVLAPAASAIIQAEVISLKPMKVVYTLAPTATWSDGSAVGIKDFIATWHDGAQGSAPTSDQYDLITSINLIANQPHSIEVEFSQPASGWRDLFSPLMPASSLGMARHCQHPSPDVDLSSGPYLIASATADGATLIENPNWTGSEPPFSAIVFTLGANEVANSLRQAGALGILTSNAPSEVLSNGVSSLPTVRSAAAFSNDLVSVDFSPNVGITKSRQMRVALASLLRRQGLVTAVGAGTVAGLSAAMSHFWTQGMINFSGTDSALPQSGDVNTLNAPNQTYDPVQAGHNLTLLGCRKVHGHWITRRGHALTVRLGVQGDDPWATAVARHLVRQWSSHGVTVDVVHFADVSLAERALRRGSISAGVVVRPTTPYLNETARWYLPSLSGSPSVLWNGYRDSTLQGPLAQAESDMNPEDAAMMYQQIDSRLWITMSSLPIMVEPTFLVASAALQGVQPNPYPPGLVAMMGQWGITTVAAGN
jgi:peptide/nickel transport system substrate-binding protein